MIRQVTQLQEQMRSKTYHYTFAIDGNINGTKTEHNRKTTELVKVDENGKVISTKSKEEIDSNTQNRA